MPADVTPSGWRESTLGDVADWVSGGTPSKSNADYWRGNIPWASPKDMKTFLLEDTQDHVSEAGVAAGSRIVPEETVLLVVRGMILAHTFPVALTARDTAINQDLKGVAPHRHTSGRFLAYWFLGNSSRMLGLVTEATHGTKRIDLADLLRFCIQLPPLPEQHRIAEILDTLDEAIRKTEQVIAKLQQVKQGLLHDLLTRGIDENGELRDPERHPAQFKRSGSVVVPAKWAFRDLGEESQFVTSGSRGWAAHYSEAGPIFLRIGNLTREHINLRFDSVICVRPPRTSEGTRTAVRDHDLLISITADLGIIGVVPEGLGEAYVNQHIALVRIDGTKANSRWIAHYLASHVGQQQFSRFNDMGAKSGLNLPTVERLQVALPERAEQDAIVKVLDSLDTRIYHERRSARTLAQLKLGLMDDLLTGRVRVPLPAGSRA